MEWHGCFYGFPNDDDKDQQKGRAMASRLHCQINGILFLSFPFFIASDDSALKKGRDASKTQSSGSPIVKKK
jgi:hypothetical protein